MMRPLFVVNLFHKLLRDRQVTAEARQVRSCEYTHLPHKQYAIAAAHPSNC